MDKDIKLEFIPGVGPFRFGMFLHNIQNKYGFHSEGTLSQLSGREISSESGTESFVSADRMVNIEFDDDGQLDFIVTYYSL